MTDLWIVIIIDFNSGNDQEDEQDTGEKYKEIESDNTLVKNGTFFAYLVYSLFF